MKFIMINKRGEVDNKFLLIVLVVVAVVVLGNNGFFTGRAARSYIEPRASGGAYAGNVYISRDPSLEIVSSPGGGSGPQYLTDECKCDYSSLNQLHFLFKEEKHCTIEEGVCGGTCKIWAAVPDKDGYVTGKSHIYTKDVRCKNTASVASSGLNY